MGLFVHRHLPILFFLAMVGCSDPVPPEFDFEEGLVYIDGLLATTPGASYVTPSISKREFGINTNEFQDEAVVTFIRTFDGKQVRLRVDGGTFLPPADFRGDVGEEWILEVRLPDGRTYGSQAETIEATVPVTELTTTYETQLFFSGEQDRYIPGHAISATFQDPAEKVNHYLWRFRSFEKLLNCKLCNHAIFREGACQALNPSSEDILKPFYTYECDTDCWQIRYEDNVNILSDEFVNGTMVSKLPIAEIPLFTKRNILVEIQQFSISPRTYAYYKTIKDLVDDNSGFNAVLPAALIGNMVNTNDPSEVVLGNFTAAGTSISRIFLERIALDDAPLEPLQLTQPEGNELGTFLVFSAPCVENRFRTGVRPSGWVD